MKLLAVSDDESRFLWEHFDPEAVRGVELILSCGDLKAAYLSFLVTMIPAPLFYVHGNHDRSYAANPPQGCACIDGQCVTYRGLRIAGLGGCQGGDPGNPHQYTEAQMRRRVRRLENSLGREKQLDILVTHAPAKGIGDGTGFHEGFACFSELHALSKPRLHLFGHIHGAGAPTGKQGVYHSGGVTLYNCAGYRILELNPCV